MSNSWTDRPRGAPPFGRIRGQLGASARLQRQRAVPLQEVRTPHLDEGLPLGRTGLDLDALFAFLLFAPMLFIGQLTTAGAAMIAAAVPLYLFLRRERLFETLLPRSFLYLPAAFALFSVTWSAAPGWTLRYAVELVITVTAGLLLSSARNQEAVLRAITVAFLAYVASSIFFGGYVNVGVGMGGEAFSGLSESKNLLGDIASTGLVAATVVLITALQGRRWWWMLIAGAAIAMDIYCVVGSRSAGALLGLVMALLGVATLTPLVYAGKAMRAWVTTMVGVCLVAIGLSYQAIAQAMIQIGANLFDKDPTLTGRTYLWYRAADLIGEKPLLGRGFYAFWLQGDIDAEGLWRYFGIDGRGGFTFHNTYIEILVMLGWAGLATFAAALLIGAAFLIRRFVIRPTLPLVFWMAILLYELARTPIETIGVAPLYFSTALVFGALGAAFKRSRSHRRAREEALMAAAQAAAAPWARLRTVPAAGSHPLARPDPGGAA